VLLALHDIFLPPLSLSLYLSLFSDQGECFSR
jgi:hypothetical protein